MSLWSVNDKGQHRQSPRDRCMSRRTDQAHKGDGVWECVWTLKASNARGRLYTRVLELDIIKHLISHTVP